MTSSVKLPILPPILIKKILEDNIRLLNDIDYLTNWILNYSRVCKEWRNIVLCKINYPTVTIKNIKELYIATCWLKRNSSLKIDGFQIVGYLLSDSQLFGINDNGSKSKFIDSSRLKESFDYLISNQLIKSLEIFSDLPYDFNEVGNQSLIINYLNVNSEKVISTLLPKMNYIKHLILYLNNPLGEYIDIIDTIQGIEHLSISGNMTVSSNMNISALLKKLPNLKELSFPMLTITKEDLTSIVYQCSLLSNIEKFTYCGSPISLSNGNLNEIFLNAKLPFKELSFKYSENIDHRTLYDFLNFNSTIKKLHIPFTILNRDNINVLPSIINTTLESFRISSVVYTKILESWNENSNLKCLIFENLPAIDNRVSNFIPSIKSHPFLKKIVFTRCHAKFILEFIKKNQEFLENNCNLEVIEIHESGNYIDSSPINQLIQIKSIIAKLKKLIITGYLIDPIIFTQLLKDNISIQELGLSLSPFLNDPISSSNLLQQLETDDKIKRFHYFNRNDTVQLIHDLIKFISLNKSIKELYIPELSGLASVNDELLNQLIQSINSNQILSGIGLTDKNFQKVLKSTLIKKEIISLNCTYRNSFNTILTLDTIN